MLETITASTGGFLQIAYDASGLIAAITDHTGRVWKYQYDSNDNLEYVIYPDTVDPSTPADDTDNPRRQYHYNETAFTSGANLPHALTGITDERGMRYATYEYYPDGRAKASYHAGDAGRVEIAYDEATATRTVTNSAGNPSIYSTITQLGTVLTGEVAGPGCAACGSGDTSYYYDTENNNLLYKRVDGVYTKYADYDGNGNYRCRVDGISSSDPTDLTDAAVCAFDVAASPDARISYYAYNDSRFRHKPTLITGPSVYPGASRTIACSYDNYGNRVSEAISGFGPGGIPVTAATTRLFNGPLNQLSQVDGPRTDVSDITVFRYYADDPGEGYNRARLREIEDATGVLIRSNIQYSGTG